jgi:hypothetical protein
LGAGFIVRHRIISAIEKVVFVSDRVSYIVLRGRWCNIVLNVHAPSEDKSDDLKEFLLRIQYCAGDKIKKNEMGGACSAHGEGKSECGF